LLEYTDAGRFGYRSASHAWLKETSVQVFELPESDDVVEEVVVEVAGVEAVESEVDFDSFDSLAFFASAPVVDEPDLA